jgi:protein arginine kinase activator
MCTNCGQRPSKIHYTEIVNNEMTSMDLCVECAEARGIDVEKKESYGLGDLVAGLIDNSAQTESEQLGKVKCPSCGFDYSSFKKIGRFGCPECYAAFEKQLIPLLRQLHGSTRHQGKSPEAPGPMLELRREIKDLQEALTEAVSDERFEEAAKIRDHIRELEAKVEE